MYSHYEAEEAERELAFIENTKKKVLSLLQVELGGIIDAKTYEYEISYVDSAIDGLTANARTEAGAIIARYGSEKRSRHEHLESTYYAGVR